LLHCNATFDHTRRLRGFRCLSGHVIIFISKENHFEAAKPSSTNNVPS
jgi:hypothetical protein